MPVGTVEVDIDDVIFQAALRQAESEGQTIGQVIVNLLREYIKTAPPPPPPPPPPPTPVAPAPVVPAPTPVTTYKVQSGDTLGRIAQKFYGDASKYPLIQKANNLTGGNIWVGQTLVIPPLEGVVPTPTPAPTPAPAPAPVTAPVFTGAPPAKPALEWVGSPNFNRRTRPDDITGLTIHATANNRLQGVIDWFNNPNSQVSAHYTIDKDGKIIQHVKDTDRAWHAGKSVWKGRENCNDFCLGIELVNWNNGTDPYPEAQHQANVALSAYLCHTYQISPDDIMAHYDISPGRKTDPKNYDMDRLRREVKAMLGV
jgi:LysM repeat protein